MAAKLANMPRGAVAGNQYASKDENKSANLQNSFVSQTQAAEMLNVSQLYKFYTILTKSVKNQ